MLEGWRNQQLARNLAFGTINGRETEVRRFVVEAGEYPWRWTASCQPSRNSLALPSRNSLAGVR